MMKPLEAFWRRPVLAMILVLAIAFSVPGTVLAKEGKTKLYVDVLFDENLFLDRYDVELYVDGTYLAALPYGKPFTQMLHVDPGKHLVRFCKKGNQEVAGEKEIHLDGDSTLQCTIKTEGKSIRIKDSTLIKSLKGASLEVPEVELTLFKKTLARLEDIGFQNVEALDEKGNSVRDSEGLIIRSQGVKAGSKIDKNEKLTLTCQQIGEFLRETFIGLHPIEAAEMAGDCGFEVSFIDILTGRDMRGAFASLSRDELKKWSVEEAKALGENTKLALLYVRYTGTSPVPDVRQMLVGFAFQELHVSGFDEISLVDEAGKRVSDPSGTGYEVLEQSLSPGLERQTDVEVTLTCRSLEKLEAETIFDWKDRWPAASVASEFIDTSSTGFKLAGTSVSEPTSTPTPKPTATPTPSPTATPLPSPTPKPRTTKTYTAITDLNIRSLPSTAGDILGMFRAYDTAEVYEITDGWAEIAFQGGTAYCSADYLSEGVVQPLLQYELESVSPDSYAASS